MYMNKLKFSILAFAGVLFGCQQAELTEPVGQPMKTVTISTEMGGDETKAAIDSQTGAVTWQSGDVISVLATDDKFYDFTLTSGAGTKYAEFAASLPNEVNVTSVATYPAIVPNGTPNTIWAENTLNYVLPTSWTWKKDVSNVPMVAIFEEGATEMAFKHVGGVMRFPVTNMPREATVIFTMQDKTITGEFPLHLVIAGEAEMVAGTAASQVIINYSSDADRQNVEFNLPVPTGVYNKFTLEIKAKDGTPIFTKSYRKDNVIKRSTLLNMSRIELNPEDLGVGTEPDNTNYDVYGIGGFPITYWVGPPVSAYGDDDAKAREIYKDMAETGINVALFYGAYDYSIQQNKRVLDICEENGMKFISLVNASTSAEKIAAIKEHLASSPNYVGDYLADEPSALQFDELGAYVEQYLDEFPDKEVYVNLFPMYAAINKLGTKDYPEHIDKYLEKVPTKSLSFDYYGLIKNSTNVGSDFYTNLDILRSKTLAARKPYWVITQAGKVGGGNRFPTEKEQRWTVWGNIAMGSKGISYFVYWQVPWSPAERPDFMCEMVSENGEKTDMYYWVKQINSDMNTIGKKLIHCHADGAISSSTRYYPLYDNNATGRTKYGPVRNVSAKSENVICGCFRDARVSENGANYKGYKVMLVAHQPNRSIRTGLTLDPSVTRITVTQNNTTETVDLTALTDYTLSTANPVRLSVVRGELIVEIPEGEFLLIEF